MKLSIKSPFFFHYNRVTLIYMCVLLFLPSTLYGIYQSSLFISYSHMQDIKSDIETDFQISIRSVNYEAKFEEIITKIEENEYIQSDGLVQIYSGLIVITIENMDIPLYFCNISKISKIERFSEKFTFLSQFEATNFSTQELLISNSLADKLSLTSRDNVNISGRTRFDTAINLENFTIAQIINQETIPFSKQVSGNRNPSNIESISYGSIFESSLSSFYSEDFLIVDLGTFYEVIIPQIGNEEASNSIWMNLIFESQFTKNNYFTWRNQAKLIDEEITKYILDLKRKDTEYIYFSPLEDNLSKITSNLLLFQLSIIFTLLPLIIFGIYSLSLIYASIFTREAENFHLLFVRGYNRKEIFSQILKENLVINLISFPLIALIGTFINILIGQIIIDNKILQIDVDFILSSIYDGFLYLTIIWVINLIISILVLCKNFLEFSDIFKQGYTSTTLKENQVYKGTNMEKFMRKSTFRFLIIIFNIIIPIWFIVYKEYLQNFGEIFNIIEGFFVIILIFNPLGLIYIFYEAIGTKFFLKIVHSFRNANNDFKFRKFFDYGQNRSQIVAIVILLSISTSHLIMSDILYSTSELRISQQAFDLVGGDYRIQPYSIWDINNSANNHVNNKEDFTSFINDIGFDIFEVIKYIGLNLYSKEDYSESAGEINIINAPVEINAFDSVKYLSILNENQNLVNSYSEIVPLLDLLTQTNSTIISSYLCDILDIQINDVLVIKRESVQYKLNVVGVYSMSNLPGVIPSLFPYSNLLLDHNHPLIQNSTRLYDYAIDYILINENAESLEKSEFKELCENNGFLLYDNQIIVQEDIEANLKNPIFKVAIYPTSLKFLYLESFLLLIIVLLTSFFLISNFILNNRDSIALVTIRGIHRSTFRKFIIPIIQSVGIVVFSTTFLGIFNAYLYFEIISKSNYSSNFQLLTDNFTTTWRFLPVLLVTITFVCLYLYIICRNQIINFIENSDRLNNWLKND